AARSLERQLVGVHVVVGAVVQNDPEVNHREASEKAALCGLDNALLDGGDIVLGNRAAEDLIDELEVAAARHGLHLDLAIAKLAVSATLFFVAALHIGLATDG